jgi:hypothetical protein
MKNKKAQITMNMIIKIMLVLAAFGLVFLFVMFGSDKASYAAEENTCHSSVVFRTMSSLNVADTNVNIGPLLCKTFDKKITGTKAELESQISKMMARCWWMYNEGRQDDLFNSAELSTLLGFDGDNNKCRLCYTVLIDQDEIEDGSIGSGELFNYLLQTDHYQIKGATYLDYIQSYGGPGEPVIMESVYPRGAYGIAYLSKSTDNSGFSWVDVGIALGAVGAVVCVATVVCGVVASGAAIVVGVAAVGYEATHAYNVVKADAFYNEERDVSMVVFDTLQGLDAGECEIITD